MDNYILSSSTASCPGQGVDWQLCSFPGRNSQVCDDTRERPEHYTNDFMTDENEAQNDGEEQRHSSGSPGHLVHAVRM